MCFLGARADEITIKTEIFDDDNEEITNLIGNTQSTISVKSEPLVFPGKPNNSKDIEIIDLSDGEEEPQPPPKSGTHPHMKQEQSCLEQAMKLADLDPQEQQAMTFKRFSCPMCNNSSHAFKEKIGVETHILKEHNITIDMLRVI